MTVDPGQMVPLNHPRETPVSEAASPRLGPRSVLPADLAVGSTESKRPRILESFDPRICDRHGMLAAGCMYCADPVLEFEALKAAQALLDEFGGDLW